MDEEKTIAQARFGVGLKFQFGADRLAYTLRDFSGELQFTAPYEAINVLAPSTLVVNNIQFMRRMSAIPVVGLFAAVAFTNINRTAADDIGILAAAALFLLLVARSLKLFAIKYTMLGLSPAPPGAGKHSIRIIHDRNHPAILAEIKTRWQARVKRLYGSINFSNDVEKEIARFTWMKEHAVITDDEYRDAVEKLRAYSAHNHAASMERSLN